MSNVSRAVAPLLVLAACTAEPPTSHTLRPDVSRDVAPAAAQTVVMSGLDAPRGLAWGPEGALYVVEAGTNIAPGPCVAGGRGSTCFSGTGAVTRLWRGQPERIVSGLPSGYNATTADIGGPSDISFIGRGNAQVSIGLGGPPASRAAFGNAASAFGTLISLTPSGNWRIVADIAAFEGTNNPAGGVLESNPFGLLAESDARYVTDAGGNSLLKVTPNGDVSLVATFAAIPVPAGPVQSALRAVRRCADRGDARARRRAVCEYSNRCAVSSWCGGDLPRCARASTASVRRRFHAGHRLRLGRRCCGACNFPTDARHRDQRRSVLDARCPRIPRAHRRRSDEFRTRVLDVGTDSTPLGSWIG
jgi:hypothetical protein